MYDVIGSRVREADLVEEGAARCLVSDANGASEFTFGKPFWQPSESRTCVQQPGMSVLGGGGTLVRPVGPVLLRVAELARVTVLPFWSPFR